MTSEKVKVCEFCEEQRAAVLCTRCCKCYCGECNEYAHKKASKKGHKVEAIPDGVNVNAMCPIHKEDALKMFCVDEVKLCCYGCKTDDLHKDHNVVRTAEITEDNEIFSALEVRKRFADVLEYDDKLDKKIEAVIEDINNESVSTREKVKQTFIEAHEKLTAEEAKVMGELEKVCSESGELLHGYLKELRGTREYSKVLSDFDGSTKEEISRFMELNLVSEMEKQRKTMENLHRTIMTDLKIGWDNEERKLSFTRSLFNGGPDVKNVNFPGVFSRNVEVVWECDESEMNENDKAKIKFIVETKKKSEEGGWKEVYSGKDKKCTVTGLDEETEYGIRVKCAIEDFQGRWCDVANVKTNKVTIDSLILSREEGKNKLSDELTEWCRTTDFELLYRGTRDGFEASDFHRRCDDKGKTLVLIKNTSGHVFGGVATISWSSTASGCNHKQAPGSFLFTLTNMYGTQPTKFPLKDENDGCAICHDRDYLPCFGSGHDIIIPSKCNENNSSSCLPGVYNDLTGKGNSIFSSSTSTSSFKIQEIEVFKVIN